MVKSRRPRVSVIVHAGGDRPLADTLQSVRSQTLRDIEILVAVPGTACPENVDAIDDSDPRIVSIVSPDTDLPARLRNRCLRRARGLFIAFIEAGDRWHREKLERQVAFMRSHPELAFTFTACEGPGSKVVPEIPVLSNGSPKLLDALLRRNLVAISTAMVRSSALRVAGRFDEASRLRGFEDYELWLRLAVRGHAADAIRDDLAWLADRGRPWSEVRLREEMTRRSILRRIERHQASLAGDLGKQLRSSLASTLTSIGRRWLRESRVQRSRRYLQNSIRTCPMQIRSYMLLALSFLTPAISSRVLRRNGQGK